MPLDVALSGSADLLAPMGFQDLQRRFSDHLRDPGAHPAPTGIEDRRLAIYRRLFFDNIGHLLASGFPVVKRVLGEAAWMSLVRRFYAEHPAHTPLFPRIGAEFLAYLQALDGRGQLQATPFLHELAHYEWVELEMSLDTQDLARVVHDPEGDVVAGIPVVNPLHRCLICRFPVHRIKPGEIPTQEPVCLVVWRTPNDDIHFAELSPLALQLLTAIAAHPDRTGGEVCHALVAALAGPEPWVGMAQDLLLRFRVQRIILGTH